MTARRGGSVLSSWARTIVDAMGAHGIDPKPVLAAAGFTEDAFRDPNARHSVSATARLWSLAAAQVGDPSFGLRVPKYVRFTTFHALGYAILASATLGEALERAVRYCRVVVDAGVLELDASEPEVALRILAHPGYEAGGLELRDAVLAMLVRTMRSLSAGAFVLSRVELKRAPDTDLAPYQRFFGCPVSLGECDVLRFERALLALPLSAANPELARLNESAVREYLGNMGERTLVDRVREAILERLGSNVSPDVVARKLGMSLRSMQRGLREHDTSYEDVLRALRLDVASRYLREGRHSHGEIAFLLGYESPSAFARAFRRWTGSTPSEYAERRRERS